MNSTHTVIHGVWDIEQDWGIEEGVLYVSNGFTGV